MNRNEHAMSDLAFEKTKINIMILLFGFFSVTMVSISVQLIIIFIQTFYYNVIWKCNFVFQLAEKQDMKYSCVQNNVIHESYETCNWILKN